MQENEEKKEVKMKLFDLTNIISSNTKVMIYIRKQFGNLVVVFHTDGLSIDELFGMCIADEKLKDAKILMLRAKDDCVHVGIGEIDVNSDTVII